MFDTLSRPSLKLANNKQIRACGVGYIVVQGQNHTYIKLSNVLYVKMLRSISYQLGFKKTLSVSPLEVVVADLIGSLTQPAGIKGANFF